MPCVVTCRALCVRQLWHDNCLISKPGSRHMMRWGLGQLGEGETSTPLTCRALGRGCVSCRVSQGFLERRQRVFHKGSCWFLYVYPYIP